MAASAAAAYSTFVSKPWRLQTTDSAPTPADAQEQQQGHGQPEPPSWRCTVLRRLGISMATDTAFGHAFAHWARKAETLATNHVRAAFEGGCAGLAAGAEGAAAGTVSTTMALAGTDVADHEATMRLTARLLATSAPSARVALVGPSDFRSFALATRRICEQLSGEGSGAADAGDDEGEDDPPHCSGQDTRKLSTPARLASWLRRGGSATTVVILVEQTDSLPKELLRDVLSTWGSACGDHGIPISCLLGLQHSPTGLQSLLGGDCVVPVIHTSAVTLFNAEEVCFEFLCAVAEDEQAPLPLFPEMLMWLRNHFLNSRRSFSRVMKALALLCDEHVSHNPLSAMCIPFVAAAKAGHVEQPASESASSWKQAFAERLRSSQELLGRLRELWVTEGAAGEPEGPIDDERLFDGVAEAAATALEWRAQLCRSLKVWDILLCTLQPTARHELQVRRMWRLLKEVWPRQTAVPSGATDSADQESSGVDKLVDICLRKLDRKTRTIDVGELQRMLELLLPASSTLFEPLQAELRTLLSSGHGEDDLCSGVQSWVQAVKARHWQPLGGLPGRLFLEALTLSPAAAGAVERRLSHKAAEAEVLALARGPLPQGPDDASLVSRLLEGAPGRTIELAELFAEFSRYAGGSRGGADGDAAKESRFGRALMQLHMQGLHAPVRSGGLHRRQKRAFAGWRTRKRIFGRVWVKAAQQSRITEFFGKAHEEVVERTVADRMADRPEQAKQFVSPICADPRDAKKVVDSKEPPWAMLALRKGPAARLQASALRDKRGPDEAANLHPAKKQRKAKIFMS